MKYDLGACIARDNMLDAGPFRLQANDVDSSSQLPSDFQHHFVYHLS